MTKCVIIFVFIDFVAPVNIIGWRDVAKRAWTMYNPREFVKLFRRGPIGIRVVALGCGKRGVSLR